MGISSGLHDVSGAAPLPLLVLASLASIFSSSSSSAAAGPGGTVSGFRCFSGLVALEDYLAASSCDDADGTAGDCTVCLSAIAEGERVRTLACRHAFHAACLDVWFDQSRLSCPLCRAGPAEQDHGEDAITWFARF